MSVITKKNKPAIIKNNQRHEKDSGSSEVQIALLTDRIAHLTNHLKSNKKDHHTRRGLLILVGKRKRILKYLQRKDEKSFLELSKKLKLKTKK